jgi:phosphate acyltransferase
MGGDFAPASVVGGAFEALHEASGRFHLLLVGHEKKIEAAIALYKEQRDAAVPPEGSYSIVHAPEVIEMEDSPNAALKTKKHSSIGVGLRLHHDGQAQAFLSAGNTGAVLSAATLILGRIHGVGRPTIGALLPALGKPCLLLDAGANVDCRPNHLREFGVMGSIYVSAMLNVDKPRVGILSIGEEDNKGNEASLEAAKLLRHSPVNFIGNVEGRDLLKGSVDVVVCDGFVGNIILKFGESIPSFFKARFKSFASGRPWNTVVGLLARNALRRVMKDMDYQEQGGVPLLGVNGITIIGHGGSTPKAVKNMIFRAEEMIAKGILSQIQAAIKQLHG